MADIRQKIKDGFLRLSPMKIILLGYCALILLGTVLLGLPAAVRDPSQHSGSIAFFTATSATCVTGLVQVDTYTHWSLFGQMVILFLIQVGGIGFMTFCISAITLTKKKIGFASRTLMQNSISAPQIGGIVRMTKFILLGTVAIEGIGAILLAFYFCPILGWAEGVWASVFHSVSAFCNAGFDIMGQLRPFSSFSGAVGDWYVNAILMLLIVVGGLGFFVHRDILDAKFRFAKMNLQSKLVLVVSASLILGGAILLFVLEQGGLAFAGKDGSEKAASALFQSVSARTAGFNTLNIASMTQAGKFLIICLMMIGGSTGSTAGGIKTTTFAVLVISIVTTFRQKKSAEALGRRLPENITRTAACIFMLYLFLSCGAAIVISRLEEVAFLDALFEAVSAIATVGLSTGMTPFLGGISHGILAFLMVFGRAGSLTMLLAFSSNKAPVASSLPMEKIQIG